MKHTFSFELAPDLESVDPTVCEFRHQSGQILGALTLVLFCHKHIPVGQVEGLVQNQVAFLRHVANQLEKDAADRKKGMVH